MKLRNASDEPGEYDANGWGRASDRPAFNGTVRAGAHGTPYAEPRPPKTEAELDAEADDPF